MQFQEASPKLPVHLLKKRFFNSVTNRIMIYFYKKHKEATILKIIKTLFFLSARNGWCIFWLEPAQEKP
jgi:hypothetical protein